LDNLSQTQNNALAAMGGFQNTAFGQAGAAQAGNDLAQGKAVTQGINGLTGGLGTYIGLGGGFGSIPGGGAWSGLGGP
jgi:hypothetical protein